MSFVKVAELDISFQFDTGEHTVVCLTLKTLAVFREQQLTTALS